MPVSPHDAKRNFEEQDKQALEQLQKHIDQYLMKNYHSGSAIRIEYNVPHVNQRVKTKFEQAYKAVGWKQVKWGSDYHTGSYVELSESEPPGYSGTFWDR